MKFSDFFKDSSGKPSSGRLISVLSFFVGIVLIGVSLFIKKDLSGYIFTLLGIAGGLKITDRFGKEDNAVTTEFEVDNTPTQ